MDLRLENLGPDNLRAFGIRTQEFGDGTHLLPRKLDPAFVQKELAFHWPGIISVGLWLLGVLLFYALKYPDSLSEKGAIDQSSAIHGLILLLTLERGMLM